LLYLPTKQRHDAAQREKKMNGQTAIHMRALRRNVTIIKAIPGSELAVLARENFEEASSSVELHYPCRVAKSTHGTLMYETDEQRILRGSLHHTVVDMHDATSALGDIVCARAWDHVAESEHIRKLLGILGLHAGRAKDVHTVWRAQLTAAIVHGLQPLPRRGIRYLTSCPNAELDGSVVRCPSHALAGPQTDRALAKLLAGKYVVRGWVTDDM
jgi:hypothetical protein